MIIEPCEDLERGAASNASGNEVCLIAFSSADHEVIR